jgi:hypothetical protein
MTVRLLCAWLLAAAVANPALAETPTPKTFVNLSTDDLSIVCARMLKDSAAHGTRLVYITEEEARLAKFNLRQSVAWSSVLSRFDSNRAMALYTWLRNRPPLELESLNQYRWCMEAGESLYRGSSQEAKARIEKEANEEFLKLRLNRELLREAR